MGLLQDIRGFLRTDQVVEPQDVEKDTRQSTPVRLGARRMSIGSSFSSFSTSPSIRSRFHFHRNALKGLPEDHHITYRFLPIISGILIPISILLSIPSLIGPWYDRTDANHVTIESRPNSLLLNLGMGFGTTCIILANICIIARFAERKVLTMTWLCIIFLTVHDLINLISVIIFGVQNRSIDYGQSFYFSIWSSIPSGITNVTLIIDYCRTKDFKNSGSGLTDKQRTLVIIISVLLCYLALGSLIQTFTLDISYIDAIYFSIVSIETIGFGDIHPSSGGSQTFTCFFISGGILNLALAVALLREVVLEAVALGFQGRVMAIRTRQRERRIRTRWRHAVKQRLRENNQPMWAVERDGENEDWHHHHHHHWWSWAKQGWNSLKKRLSREPAHKHRHKRKHLNLRGLTETQMEEAALEAGAPLSDLVPPGLHLVPVATDDMVHVEGEDEHEGTADQGGVGLMHSLTIEDEAHLESTVAAEERIAFIARLSVALLLFVVFWMAGSAVFMATENWDFGRAVYFCFIAFTTVGYGDYSPSTPAGRSIFVAWALLGVATMTILISIVGEAYSNQFKTMIRTESPQDDVNSTHGSVTRQIRFPDRMGNAGTKGELLSPRPGSAMLSATSGWEPSLEPVHEGGALKHNKESLQEILRHAESLRTLISPENWGGDANSIESTSNMADSNLGTPQVDALSNSQGQREVDKRQIEKTTQEIIAAAVSALEVLNGAGEK